MDDEADELTPRVQFLLRALIGVSAERLADLLLRELEEEEVRHLAFYLLAAEHEGYTDSLASLFEQSDPVPESLQRIAALEARVKFVTVQADKMAASLKGIDETLSRVDEQRAARGR